MTRQIQQHSYGSYIIGIVSRHGLGIEACYRNQPNKVSYHCISHCFHFKSSVKQLYISNKTECFSYKGGYGIHECMCIEAFTKELVWAIDKQLWVISNIMSVLSLRN